MNFWVLALLTILALFWGGVIWSFGIVAVLKAAGVGVLIIVLVALSLCAVPVSKDG
jgi:hypothetical protein